MIKSLPLLPKPVKNNPYAKQWRRKFGVLRAQYLIAVDAYAIILDDNSTENERRRAMGKLIAYTSRCSTYAERVKYLELPQFISNDDNW